MAKEICNCKIPIYLTGQADSYLTVIKKCDKCGEDLLIYIRRDEYFYKEIMKRLDKLERSILDKDVIGLSPYRKQ